MSRRLEAAKEELDRVYAARPRLTFYTYERPAQPDSPADQTTFMDYNESSDRMDAFLLERLTMVYLATETMRDFELTKEDMDEPDKPRDTPIKEETKMAMFYRCGRCIDQAVNWDFRRLSQAPSPHAVWILLDAVLALVRIKEITSTLQQHVRAKSARQ